jgi:predicted DNA-binding transcriptional regulator YafY
MAINKHAWIRYQKLDECFSNSGRNYGIPELMEACNEALIEHYPNSNGISRRQIYKDIEFMESSQGWSIDLNKKRVGRRKFYRYADPSFSIRNQRINPTEAEQLRSAFMVLSRFKGLPQFDWIQEMQVRLEDELGLKESSKSIVGYQENPYLKGLNFFEKIFNAILNQQSLLVSYQGFRHEHPVKYIFSPWYLKQFNTRWYVFGRDKNSDFLLNLPLDRIQNVEDSSESYIVNTSIDFDEYFEDIVGVTILQSEELKKISLKVDAQLAPYIETKPLHGSQREVERNNESVVFSIEVVPNFELEKLILSFGDQMVVLSPEDFRERIRTRIKNNLTHYN